MVQWISQVSRWLLVAVEVCVYVCVCVLGVTPDSIISLSSPATLLKQPCTAKALFPKMSESQAGNGGDHLTHFQTP